MGDAVKLHGSVAPLVTPLTDDEEVDTGAVKRLAAWQREAGTDALFLLGTCGEGPCLPESARLAMIEATLAASELPVFVGVAETGTRRAVAWARQAARAEIAALVAMPPIFQYAQTPEEHLAYFRAIADAVDLPLILYNLPKVSGGQAIPLAAIEGLLADGRVIGIKDSSGDMDYLAQVLALKTRWQSFGVMNGELRTAAAALHLGADGLVMSYTNVDPAASVAMIAAARRTEWTAVEAYQRQFVDNWQTFPATASPAARAKAILAARGLCSPRCCSPATSLAPWLPEALQEVSR